MTPEVLVTDGLEVVGDIILTAEATEDVTEEVVPLGLNPVVTLTEAYAAAQSLALAGATLDIRYAGQKAERTILSLLKHLEKHRQVVGGAR